MLDRRRFLFGSAAVASVLGISPALFAETQNESGPPLPPADLHDSNEEAYWAEIRKQFLIPSDEVYLNNGTVGSSPRPVLRAIFDSYRQCEELAQDDPEDYPIWGYAAWNEYRDPLAKFVGADRDEIAIVRNATEANNYIANGLDMKLGDEVLMSDQEHPGGEQPWQMKAKRYGVVVKKYQIPLPPKSPADILNRINDAITPRTRIVFTSHISTSTGVVQPVKEIAALARDKGILSAFDGAHVTGMMALDLHDIGCDMYTSSPHKWLQAPKGTGYLYVRPEVQDRLWNTIATAGWDEPKLKAERFQRIGSSNLPMLAGLKASIEFANNIGMDRIERRHRLLANRIMAEMSKRRTESWTSPDPTLRCGIVTVNVAPILEHDLEYWMWREKKIRIRGGGPSKLRLSTPYYLLPADMDRFLSAYDEYRQKHA
ncbi:MAG TPA: aminotransferase class V-fold PLP-dependent enzyme [Terriglobales bacterium]|nr:aminotransferase class V-fold PLP-dependent enzyme [Terriglobales bacterium]